MHGVVPLNVQGDGWNSMVSYGFEGAIIVEMKAPLLFGYVALMVGCTGPSLSKSTDVRWAHGLHLDVDGRTRNYSLFEPTVGDAQGLMVVLHGGGDSVERMISEMAVEAMAEENGLIVAVPAGVDNGWNDEDLPGGEFADDVGFIDALVGTIATAHPELPASHMFAHGFSNGGGMATRLACESTRIRGVGVVGNYYVPGPEGCPRPVGHPVPGWFGAGLDDELVEVGSVRETVPSYAEDLTDCSSSGSLQPVDVPDAPSDVVCKEMSDCDAVQLCEYADRGHEMLPGSFSAAWRFLSEAVNATVE